MNIANKQPEEVNLWFTSEIDFPSVASALRCKKAIEDAYNEKVEMLPAEGTGVHFQGNFDLNDSESDTAPLLVCISHHTHLENVSVKYIYKDSSGYFGGCFMKVNLTNFKEIEFVSINDCFEGLQEPKEDEPKVIPPPIK